MIRLKLANFIRPGDACHYARVTIDSPRSDRPHRHDFHEMFWVLEGEGQHWVSGQPRPLQAGAMTLIRADDVHTFSGRLCMVNVAFSVATWEYLRRRYGLTRLFAAAPIADREHALPPLVLREVEAYAAELATGARGRLVTEQFLINVFRLLQRRELAATLGHAPDWLTGALRRISTPPNFQSGPRGLARMAGRSAEHVSRELRRWTGKTPTEVVNEARMAYAASRLTASNDTILNIAMDCGFESLGHFYRLFQSQFAMTPRAYRLKQQEIIFGRMNAPSQDRKDRTRPARLLPR